MPYPDVARDLGGSSVLFADIGKARPTFPCCGRAAWHGRRRAMVGWEGR